MEARTLPFSSLNDIVFEGRNKAYGAYALRQNYNRELLKAAAISFSSTLFLFGIFYLVVQSDADSNRIPNNAVGNKKVYELMPEPILPKAIIPEPIQPTTNVTPAVAAPKIKATTAFKEIKIVSNETLVTDIIPSQTDFMLSDPGLQNVAGENPLNSAILEGNETEQTENTEVTAPFLAVEQMPEFPDGLAAMYKFINKNLRYPAQAQARGLEGNVILTFIVGATGQITDIKVLQDIGGGTAEEAQRVIAKMPNWRPGRQNKKAVPVRFTLPIKFKLN
jgi:periplasmic protein TonB